MSDLELTMMRRVGELKAENARLKAEVERLRASSFVTAVPSHQYERIVKAGDAMADYLFDAPYPCRIFYHKWIEAKEGKGQP